jgi:hypothetical protein
MGKYYYKVKNARCLEPCPIKPEIMIGSENCTRCDYFIYGHAEFLKRKGFIECEKLNQT